MADQQYIDPVLKKYADLINTTTKVFKRTYFGDPVRVGSSELPALILAKVDTRVSNFSNTQDQHTVRISLTVITDVRDSVNDDKTMVRGINSLYDIMEGRQDGTYALKTESLLGIIRHNVELDVAQNLRTDLNTLSTVQYGFTMDKRKQNSWGIEGMLEVSVNFIQNR